MGEFHDHHHKRGKPRVNRWGVYFNRARNIRRQRIRKAGGIRQFKRRQRATGVRNG